MNGPHLHTRNPTSVTEGPKLFKCLNGTKVGARDLSPGTRPRIVA